MVERLVRDQEVASSNLVTPTLYKFKPNRDLDFLPCSAMRFFPEAQNGTCRYAVSIRKCPTCVVLPLDVVLNSLDYDDWRPRFGNTSGTGSSLVSVIVPKPLCWLLFFSAFPRSVAEGGGAIAIGSGVMLRLCRFVIGIASLKILQKITSNLPVVPA